MAGGGGNDQMLNMGLMIAAGIAAPELAPVLMEGGAGAGILGGALSATEATALTGAGLSGIAGGLTGQDVGRSALMGGLGGAAAGYFGGVNPAEQGSMLAAGETAPGAGFNTVGAGANPSASAANINAPTPKDYSIFTGETPVGMSGASTNSSIYSGNSPFTVQGALPDSGFAPNVATPATASTSPSTFDKANMIGGGVAGINSLISAPQNTAYVPPNATYKGGNLSKFKYDPNLYTPDVVVPPTPYKAHYAQGGITNLAIGGQAGQTYPMSQQEHTNFMNPTQLPSNAMDVRNFEPATNPFSGDQTQAMASGGIAQLAVGGKLLKGNGDGMSDDIKANIGGRQEARLADGEFVVPADVVSHLGNGSTDAGAKHLYSMMDKVRQARVGTKKQGRQINPNRYLQA